jgi:hypothetical protein
MSHSLETIMQTTILTSTDVVESLKTRAKWANKEFIKNPNATRWNVQTRDSFVYQQAFYFFGSVTRTAEQKHNLLVILSKLPQGEWDDAICQSALGMSLVSALRDHANCP